MSSSCDAPVGRERGLGVQVAQVSASGLGAEPGGQTERESHGNHDRAGGDAQRVMAAGNRPPVSP